MVQKLHIWEKVYFDQLLDFPILLLSIIPSHFIGIMLVFSVTSVCQTVWIQGRPHILLGLTWVQTVCKGYQQMTKVAASGQRVRHRTREHSGSVVESRAA